ncbi:hypothetical protein [Nocardia sp. NPDC005366]|uniref:hypothetical protein n=1 Tax=Nocardia sp. NPDC005366 TaxID=3156878 RepID=UPI0033B9397D
MRGAVGANGYRYVVFSIAALVPSPPILVPELVGATSRTVGADPDDPPTVLRAAVSAAAATLAGAARHWTVLGSGDADRVFGPDAVGTFLGFGVDVRVALSGDPTLDVSADYPADSPADSTAGPDRELPLPVLIAGWLRGQFAPEVTARARVIAADSTVRHCAELGAELRAELDASDEPHGVLVVADGAATLSLKAPGYLDERAAGEQEDLERALGAGDRAALLALDPALCAELSVSGRAAYQALAGLFASDAADPSVDTLYRDAPYGVGYHVSVWRPGGTG